MRMLALANRNFKEVLRDPISVILGVGMPVGLLLLFNSIFSSSSVQVDAFLPVNLTPGMVLMSFSFIMMFSGMLLANDRKTAFMDRLLASPLKPVDYIVAYSLPFIPVSLIQFAICFSVSFLFGVPVTVSILTTYIVFFPVLIICVSLGTIMGLFLQPAQISGIGTILINIFTFSSGAWFDLSMIKGTMNKICYGMPFSHSVDAARLLLKGAALGDIGKQLIIVYAYAVVFFILGTVSFRFKLKR